MGFLYNVATNFMTEHRGVFVTVFVLPISLAFDVFFTIRAWAVMKFYSAPELHKERVAEVSAQVKTAMKDAPPGTKLCTARGGWQSISPSLRPYKKVATTIEVNLYDILSLNKAEGWVHVEPMVNMGQLSHYLVPHGLTIPVLPEMDDLTVGGLFMGTGIEGSSHKYGLFDDFIVEAEVVLANGDIVTCSKTQDPELFDALPWSYGTLGFLVSCKIKVIPSKPYVRIEYIPCRTKAEGVETFTEHSCAEKPADFVEGLAYSLDTMVVMPANMVDASEVDHSKLNRIGLWFKPWFFKHVEEMLAKSTREDPVVEYIPLRDYYHRHTKAIFWELQDIIPFANNVVFRYLLGWAVPPKVSFLKLTQTPAIRKLYEEEHAIQDMLVPISKFGECLDVFHKHYEIYPLWICPYRRPSAEHHFLKNDNDELIGVDVGAYGVPQRCRDKLPYDIVKESEAVEGWVLENDSAQMLYATSYLTREQFNEMFNHEHYAKMKKKLDPNGAFPEVYDKVCRGAAKVWEQRAAAKNKKDD